MASADRHSRTEQATPKRRKEARQRGQVARAPDISAWLLLLVGSYLLPPYFSSARSHLLGLMTTSAQIGAHPDAQQALNFLGTGLMTAAEVILPLAAGLGLVAGITGFLEVGRGASLKSIRPQWSRISPKSGFKRIVSSQGAISLAKQVGKLAALGGLGYSAIESLMRSVPSSVPVPLQASVGVGASSLLRFSRTVALIGLGIGAADYFISRRRLGTSIKMTKQEVKDEAKDREGDPTMRAEIRKRSFRLARSRLLAAVRTADVVIANPTHVVVALRYDPEGGRAPVVVAKALDELALRVKQEARDVGVPVVEDPPLARYLYVGCEIGDQIPREIFAAVARLLAFIYSLPAPWRVAGVHHLAPSMVPYDPGPGLARHAEELIGAAL